VVAYRKPSNGRELLSGLCSSRNISTNNFLSFIPDGGWRLGDCGLDKTVLEVEGYQRKKLHTRVRSCLLGSFGLTVYGLASH
jgi:hypothetical protein